MILNIRKLVFGIFSITIQKRKFHGKKTTLLLKIMWLESNLFVY